MLSHIILLCSMRNKPNLDNGLLRQGLQRLSRQLPPAWRADISGRPGSTSRAYPRIKITAPDGTTGLIAVETRQHLEPRDVADLRDKLRDLHGERTALVIAPYLSPSVRERLRGAAIAFLDLSGNTHLELRNPGLFIETQGAAINPNRQDRPSRSLRGPKAGRLVRVLIDSREIPGVRELAKIADVDPGYVSRVLALLAKEALVERSDRGRVIKMDWQKLLRRWAEDAPLQSRGSQATYLVPRGLKSLYADLKNLKMRYAITGTAAAVRVAPIAPPRLAMLYAQDAERMAVALKLHAAEAGANVLIIEPPDADVFSGVTVKDGLSFVSLSQAAADLLTSPGRGPSEAEELIAWMSAHEEEWRG